MGKKSERDFIKISQVVGQAKVIGSLSIWSIIPLIVVILLIYGLSLLKISLFKSMLIGIWLLGTILMVTGARPDRLIRRLLGKPKRWRRGFHPSSPLLGKPNKK